MTARPPPRLRAGVVAGLLLAVAVTGLAAGVLIIDQIGETVIAARQREVAEAARDYFVAIAHEEGLPPLARALDRRERSRGREGFRYALYSNAGQLMGGARLLRMEQLPGLSEGRVMIWIDGRQTPWAVLVQPISVGGTLVVYEDLAERAAFRRALVVGATAALMAAMAAMLAASFWLNRLIYRRAEAIEHTATQIAGGRLSARAPADPKGDVFDRLGGAINAMLDHNEELMTGLRTVTDSLAHDLRSPLTRMKGALTKALEAGDDGPTRDDAIAEAWKEADRALATASALLDIARAETGLSRTLFQPVDLGPLVDELAELFGPTIEDAGQTLEVQLPDLPIRIQGHELLLRQALGNLLFNASRYAGRGAKVRVSVQRAPGFAQLVVADTGPGIPPEDRGRVQERFVRLDAARTTQGSGLGLAIAAACAKLHRGALVLEENDPGLRVVLSMAG